MIGDTTIVYWSEEAEEVYQNIFSMAAPRLTTRKFWMGSLRI